MISRREAMKIGAFSLIAPSLGMSPAGSTRVFSQESGGNVPMFRGNAAQSGVMPGPGPSIDKPIIVKWVFQTAGSVTQRPRSPLVENNTVFFSDDVDGGTIYAINFATGTEIWRSDHSLEVSHNGLSVMNGVLYASSASVTDHSLYALDAKSGSILWQFIDGVQLSSPTIIDDVVLVSTGNNLHSLDSKVGTELWRFNQGDRDSSPAAVSNGIVYSCGGNNLFAIDLETGTKIWDFNIGIKLSSPSVADNTVFVKSDAGKLHAIDAVSGIEAWRSESFGGAATLAGNVIYVGSSSPWNEGGRLQAFEADSGNELWQHDHGGSHPTISNSVIYAGGNQYLGAIDAVTGHELWRYSAEDNLSSSPAVVSNFVYVGGSWGNLYAIGNLVQPVLILDVTLHGAPSYTGVVRGTAEAGAVITDIRDRAYNQEQKWIEVTIDDVSGWIPADAVDPTTLPPEGEIEYVYVPD